MQKLLLGLTIILSVLIGHQGKSQSISDIKNINVDELTSEQMGSLIEQLEASGMDEGQLIDLAKANGMSDGDISKLRTKIKQEQSGGESDGTVNTASRLRTDPTATPEGLLEEPTPEVDNTLTAKDSLEFFDDGLEIFGMRFFRTAELTFEPGLNIPSPSNYVLGPGDQLFVDIWGTSERVYQLTISPEGSVAIPRIGPIFVNGLTVEKAKTKIVSKLKTIHSAIGRGSYADVTLGQIRTISVHVIGEVHTPGTYVLSSFGTVFNALYNAGGPSKNGSLRRIEVYRNRELVSTFDAYDFFIRGTGNNITLTDQDVIIVRPYVNRVRLQGQVKRPAAFEMKEGEVLSDLLLYSGGFTKDAYRGTINVNRNDGNFRTIKSIDQDQYDSFVMENGDELFIKEISNEYKSRVTLEGPLLNTGDYELTTGLTLSELIKKADGFRGDVFMERGIILRQNKDYSLTSLTFDPRKILSGENDVLLANNDVVRFQSIYDLREEYSIRIEGEILTPGKYEYIQDLTVENLVFMAGGFRESAARSFVEVARRNNLDSAKDVNKSAEIFKFTISKDLSLSEEASNFKLMPFDVVMIRKSPFFQNQELIEIEGEAKYPGVYAMERKDERISSVLKRAGGITPYAYPKGATLIRRTEYYKSVEFGETSVHVDDDAAEMRRQDLTNRFKKEGLSQNDSIELFRQQESIGINLDKIMKNPGSKYDIILKEGDILSIPRELQTVRVRGEVLYPSNIQHDKTAKFKHYISTAGGFDQLAKKSKAYIIYANGSAAQTRSFIGIKKYPKVEPGAEIVVPLRPERTPMTPQAWVAFATSIGTLALLIQNITGN